MNKNRMDRLAKEGILDLDDYESLQTCESYLLGKITKSPFKEKGEWAINILSLVYSDVCGSMSISAKGGFNYFITFTDNLSKYGYIHLIKYKSELFEMFKLFHKKVEK